MPEIKGEQLNHIYDECFENDEITLDVGNATQQYVKIVELFQKGAAMLGGIQNLPFIRSIDSTIWIRDLMANVGGSANRYFGINVIVINGRVDENNPPVNIEEAAAFDIIYMKNFQYSCDDTTFTSATTSQIMESGGFVPQQSSILGKSALSIVIQLTAGVAASGSAITVENILTMIEVDWVKANKQQVDDYIREAWFAEGDDER